MTKWIEKNIINFLWFLVVGVSTIWIHSLISLFDLTGNIDCKINFRILSIILLISLIVSLVCFSIFVFHYYYNESKYKKILEANYNYNFWLGIVVFLFYLFFLFVDMDIKYILLESAFLNLLKISLYLIFLIVLSLTIIMHNKKLNNIEK